MHRWHRLRHCLSSLRAWKKTHPAGYFWHLHGCPGSVYSFRPGCLQTGSPYRAHVRRIGDDWSLSRRSLALHVPSALMSAWRQRHHQPPAWGFSTIGHQQTNSDATGWPIAGKGAPRLRMSVRYAHGRSTDSRIRTESGRASRSGYLLLRAETCSPRKTLQVSWIAPNYRAALTPHPCRLRGYP